MISVPIQSNINLDWGPEGDTFAVTNIQLVLPFKLNDDWNLVTRTILPVVLAAGAYAGAGPQVGAPATPSGLNVADRAPSQSIPDDHQSYQIDADRHLVPIDRSRHPSVSHQPDSMLWLDVEGPDRSVRAVWLDRLGVGGLARRLCLEFGDRPGLYPLKDEIVLVIPLLSVASGEPEVQHLTCLCRQGLLLTLHARELATDDRLAEIAHADAWLSERSIPALLSAVLIDLSMDNLRLTGELRSGVIALEERMDQDPDTVQAQDILALRSDLLTLAAAVGDVLPIVQALNATKRPFFRVAAARDFMQCALVNLQAADGQLTWLDGRVSALRSGFEMHAQEQVNRRLNMLTILSAIFMPVTLLASIWGMNFATMPELGLPYAYPIALGVMVAVGSGMYLFFRKTGWFDRVGRPGDKT
jgi:magnesium transporter